jgi:hypothetical protein
MLAAWQERFDGIIFVSALSVLGSKSTNQNSSVFFHSSLFRFLGSGPNNEHAL